MQFYSSGKLLLTGEYLVLDGAQALAVPTRLGQHMRVKPTLEPGRINWISKTHTGETWLTADFQFRHGTVALLSTSDVSTATRLQEILSLIAAIHPDRFNEGNRIETQLEFPQDWGLGSSSTLIANLAQWSGVDAYYLLEQSFGGSGYDLACAQAKQAILFQRKKNLQVNAVDFIPTFVDKLYFIHLNQKQNSREGIAHYRSLNQTDKRNWIRKSNQLTQAFLKADTVEEFQELIHAHEALLSTVLQLEPVKKRLFPDFDGAVKSLGAWGGDFVLATGKNTAAYFSNQGFHTQFTYGDLVKTD